MAMKSRQSGKRSNAGGGIGSCVVVEKNVRTGKGGRGVSPRGASQIGSSMGNHSTERAAILTGAVEPLYQGPAPAGNTVQYGNQKALDVGKGGVGTGREIIGKSGSQGQHGRANPGNPTPKRGDILSGFGPDSANARMK